jgi:chlorite dismutase
LKCSRTEEERSVSDSSPKQPDEPSQVPQTVEGWYVLHDVYVWDWERWRAEPEAERGATVARATEWLSGLPAGKGDSALYSVLTQKGDLMFVHYRETPDALGEVELELRKLALHDFLQPSYSYFSVIEVSLYEITAIATGRVLRSGVERGTPEFDAAFAEEMERQKEHMNSRLFRDVPPQRYVCFYPMDKKRGEHVNWYTLSLDERRAMMRGHGTIGHKYHETVTQVIAGSVGLDDWEWGVSLHSDDMLVFKKLIYEMRFDPASALYAEFGPFYLGIRRQPGDLAEMLAL